MFNEICNTFGLFNVYFKSKQCHCHAKLIYFGFYIYFRYQYALDKGEKNMQIIIFICME